YIGDTVTIQAGGSGCTVDLNLYHIFIDGPTVDYVKIDNVDLYGGQGTDGGAIANFSGADLTLSNLTISYCTGTDNGGGVWQYGGNLYIDNVVFSHNSSSNYGGGAIYFGALDF